MKKILCLVLALFLLFTCAACQTVQYEYYSDAEWEEQQGEEENMDNTEKTTVEKIETEKTTKTRKTKGNGENEEQMENTTTGNNNTVKTDKTQKTEKTNKTDKTKESVKVTTGPTEDPAVYPSHTDTVKSLISGGKWLAQGRAALVGDNFQMDFSNAGFEIKGKLGGEISITTSNERDATVLNVIVDDGAPMLVTVKKGDTKTVLIPNLLKGNHTIKVISGTSARYGGLSVKSISYDGELAKISRVSNKLTMEVIGDSISCASGLDLAGKGPAWNGSISKAEEIYGSNAYYSYAAVAAQRLNADLSVAARCGYTLNQMKSYYKKLNLRSDAANWNFANNQVDIVVINLGTNGGGSTVDVKNMIQDVRGNYPNASIVWVSGMMSTATVNESKLAVQELKDAGDSKVFALNLQQYDVSGGYDGGHPTRAEHQTSGEALATFIKNNVL
jgi:lysophospholipase L1-like esterase